MGPGHRVSLSRLQVTDRGVQARLLHLPGGDSRRDNFRSETSEGTAALPV